VFVRTFFHGYGALLYALLLLVMRSLLLLSLL
jgi:hypothetical protein